MAARPPAGQRFDAVPETGMDSFGKTSGTELHLQNFLYKTLRETPALHLDEPNWIIDGFYLHLFLDSTQPQLLKIQNKYIFFFNKQTTIKLIQ